MAYRLKMEQASEKNESNIVLALDFPFEEPESRSGLFAKANEVLDAVHPYVCAVKFNHHLVLPLGVFDGVGRLVEKAHEDGLMAIMDCKANDIGSTNEVIAKYYFAAGFDALIANPFIGWEEGLKPIFDVARRQRRGVILLVYMSHKGAHEGYGQTVINAETGRPMLQYVSFAQKALKLDADGVVVGATYLEKIREVHDVLSEKIPIYSPGIGVQGGAVQKALDAGSRYLIVGREITLSQSPVDAAKKIRDLARPAARCRRGVCL
jgi:orotidine-5'-phosphate decarboxylase